MYKEKESTCLSCGEKVAYDEVHGHWYHTESNPRHIVKVDWIKANGKKTVMLPLVVPEGKYCWEYNGHAVCEHFDNEGGLGECSIFRGHVNRDDDGYTKLPECLALKSNGE